MEQNIKVSVIVAAYNVAQWLPACLESLLNQTYADLELIVINDGSKDETAEIIDRYAKKDARIIPVHQENQGLVAVRERGIAMASGEYVGFVDGDDAVEPDMYERLVKNAIKYHADISHCGILYCFSDGRKKPMHGTNQVLVQGKWEGLAELLKGERVEPSLCNKIYARYLLEDSCINRAVINNEDLLRNYILFERAEKSVFEDFCGYCYWRRNGSISNNTQAMRCAQHVVKAREEIYNAGRQEVWPEVCACYLSGLVGAFNSTRESKEMGVKPFRRQLRTKIIEHRKEIQYLDAKKKLLAYLIMYCPLCCDLLSALHFVQIKRRIKNQVKKLQGE